MVLRRLERINSSGIFADFRWDAALPELDRITVVFGRNGTGKTSLAGALDGLRHSNDGVGWKRVSVAIDDASGARTTAAAEMDAVLTIGERPVDAEKRLEVLRELVASKTEERDNAAQEENAANQAVDAAYRQISQEVVDTAGRAGGR
ncbi:AAA family ATPase, partial [Mycobacterium marinum]|uniref:AAA family ATPase n=1 Tax=Mycobacterium marinum TaxID=1781 RepID=UPI00356A385B